MARSRKHSSAFTMIELLVTVFIASMVCLAIFEIISSIMKQTKTTQLKLTRMTSIQFCLDKMMDDVITAAQAGDKIEVNNDSYSWHETSQLKLTSVAKVNSKPLHEVEWVAVPRYEQEDMILFRREATEGEEEEAKYIPLCDSLYSLKIEMLNDEQYDHTDPNTPPALIQLEAKLFATDYPMEEQVITINRTFCLNRFQFPNYVSTTKPKEELSEKVNVDIPINALNNFQGLNPSIPKQKNNDDQQNNQR